jgi:hypothetical protein
MKVIFLDHDGVICLSGEWGGRAKKRKKCIEEFGITSENDMPVQYRFDDFNKKAVTVLNRILEETGAEIVVSSDWKRWATLEEMGEYYEQQGIIKKPVGFTKTLQECTHHNEDVFVWSREWDLEQSRSVEIKQYLIDHPEITHWVAVDDLNMDEIYKNYEGEHTRDWGLKNFVLSPNENEGIKQTGLKEKIISYLI